MAAAHTFIFDCFGVIVPPQYPDWLRRHGLARVGELANISSRADIGQIEMSGFFQRLAAATGQTPAEVAAEFEAAITINDDVILLARELKARGHRIGLLSNSGRGWVRHILSLRQLEPLFDAIIISAEVGLVKPQAEIFTLALKELKSTPQEAVFIDDNPDNINSANSCGIHAIRFHDATDLRRQLLPFLEL